MIHILLNVVKMFNYFPTKVGISNTHIPETIMSGKTLEYRKHLCLQLGKYCQVHEEDFPRNIHDTRNRGAICLGPSSNLQGGFKILDLNSPKKVVRQIRDAIPMPNTVIARADTLGGNQPG